MPGLILRNCSPVLPGQQPPLGARVNYANPLTRGLINLWSQGLDVAQNVVAVPQGGGVMAPFIGANCLSIQATSEYVDLGTALTDSGSFTYYFEAYVTGDNNTGNSNVMSWGDRSSVKAKDATSGTIQFYTANGGTYNSVNGPTVAYPLWCRCVCIHDEGTANLKSLYSNVFLNSGASGVGRSLFTNTGATRGLNPTHHLRLGFDDETSRSFFGFLPMAAVWNRALTAVEALVMLDNPWRLFSPQPHLSQQAWAILASLNTQITPFTA